MYVLALILYILLIIITVWQRMRDLNIVYFVYSVYKTTDIYIWQECKLERDERLHIRHVNLVATRAHKISFVLLFSFLSLFFFALARLMSFQYSTIMRDDDDDDVDEMSISNHFTCMYNCPPYSGISRSTHSSPGAFSR